MSNKYLIVIRGLSGSGKSTLANLICNTGTIERVAISADDYFTDDNDHYVFDHSKLSEAHDWCKAEVESCAKEGYEVIVVHNTFTKRWEVSPYMEIAQRHGYRVQIINLYDNGLNDAQLAERCVHNIPITSINSQRERWELDVYRGSRPFNPHGNSRFPNDMNAQRPRYGNREFQPRGRNNFPR